MRAGQCQLEHDGIPALSESTSASCLTTAANRGDASHSDQLCVYSAFLDAAEDVRRSGDRGVEDHRQQVALARRVPHRDYAFLLANRLFEVFQGPVVEGLVEMHDNVIQLRVHGVFLHRVLLVMKGSLEKSPV